jgi:hypothetical protein
MNKDLHDSDKRKAGEKIHTTQVKTSSNNRNKDLKKEKQTIHELDLLESFHVFHDVFSL